MTSRDQDRRREEPGRPVAASRGSTTRCATSPTSSPWSTARPTASPSRPAMIQHSVDSVKSGLSSFAADARDNGGQLLKDPRPADPARDCCPTRCSTGSPSAACGSTTRRSSNSRRKRCARSRSAIEHGIDRGEIDEEEVFDTRLCADAGHQPGRSMKPASATSPTTCPADPRPADGRGAAADRHRDHRHQRLSADPSSARARSRRVAIPSGMPNIAATGATSSTTSPGARSPATRRRCSPPTAWTWARAAIFRSRTCSCPLYVNGRRWGNFELAYRDGSRA